MGRLCEIAIERTMEHCSNPSCFGVFQALQQSGSNVCVLLECHALSPTERDVLSMGDRSSQSNVGRQQIPFADLVYRAVFQGTSPSS